MVKVVEPSFEILTPINGDAVLKHLERIGRTCYKSEDRITEDGSSARKFIKMIVDMGHEAMIEHFSVSIKLVADTGFLKDITRHRVASFAVESTRYCLYSKDKFGNEITVTPPPELVEGTEDYNIWLDAMKAIEKAYLALANKGYKPDVCRMLLPHSLKSEINITANLREWRHIFKLRCSKRAHPTVHTLMRKVRDEFKRLIPVVFDDLVDD